MKQSADPRKNGTSAVKRSSQPGVWESQSTQTAPQCTVLRFSVTSRKLPSRSRIGEIPRAGIKANRERTPIHANAGTRSGFICVYWGQKPVCQKDYSNRSPTAGWRPRRKSAIGIFFFPAGWTWSSESAPSPVWMTNCWGSQAMTCPG